MKKFYKLVSHTPHSGGYHILLDGRAVKRPSKAELVVPTQVMADEIVKEWAAQGEAVIPDTMPLTQILITCQDRVAQNRASIQEGVLKYLDTDLICYPAEGPEGLSAMQDDRWGRWRGWFESRFGVGLKTTTGLAALKQEKAAHEAALSYVGALDDERFTVLQLVTSLCGSLILALAFAEGEAEAQDILNAAFAEEDYHAGVYDAEKYGDDPMLAKRRDAMTRDLNAARVFLDCL